MLNNSGSVGSPDLTAASASMTDSTKGMKRSPSNSVFNVLKCGPLQVTIIGGGNWGTAIAKIVAENAAQSYIFKNEIRLWLKEEELEGRFLTETINSQHENVRYLPGVALPHNIVAYSDLQKSVDGAHLLVFVCPHQFLESICQQLCDHVNPQAKAISLIKGLSIENGKPKLCTHMISDYLGIDCSILSGANVAKDIAAGQFSETTIGFTDRVVAAIWQQLFDAPYFRVNCVPDVVGVEMCGAIKNIIALAAGFCDGMSLGTNSKAAIIRIGVEEMKLFACLFFNDVVEETFYDSAGFADVVTTCFGGRNVKCAKEFVLRNCESSWEDIEAELLNGQKLQGNLCCEQIYEILCKNQLFDIFPLFTATHQVAFQGYKPSNIVDVFMKQEPRPIKHFAECNPCVVPPKLSQARHRMGAVGGESPVARAEHT